MRWRSVLSGRAVTAANRPPPRAPVRIRSGAVRGRARSAHRDGRRSVFLLRAPGPGPLRGGGRRAAWWCGAAAGGPPDRAAGAGGGARRVRSLVDCHHSRPRRPTILTTCCGPVEHGDASTHLCAHSMAKCRLMTLRLLMNAQLRRGGWTKQPKAGGGGPNAPDGVGPRRGHRSRRTPAAGAHGPARPVRRAVDTGHGTSPVRTRRVVTVRRGAAGRATPRSLRSRRIHAQPHHAESG